MTIIASGATTSSAVVIDWNQASLTIQFPAAFDGTYVTVYGSIDGDNYYPIYNDGIALTIPYVASSIHIISPFKTYGLHNFKLVSQATETAERTILISCAKVV